MTAAILDLSIRDLTVPREVRAFLREAEKRIDRFQRDNLIPGFVPSDFRRVFLTLRAVAEADLAAGNLFCEWGSGFGVITCLAAMLDFDAWGIEIERELIDSAQELADDFELPVEFVHGSFLPTGADVLFDDSDRFSWLSTATGGAHEELGLDPEDFDVIYVYPWPDEVDLTVEVFERYARPGALLIMNQGTDDLRVRRKTGRRR